MIAVVVAACNMGKSTARYVSVSRWTLPALRVSLFRPAGRFLLLLSGTYSMPGSTRELIDDLLLLQYVTMLSTFGCFGFYHSLCFLLELYHCAGSPIKLQNDERH